LVLEHFSVLFQDYTVHIYIYEQTLSNIPKLVYTDLEQQSPPTSPTFSAIIENIQNELNVLTSEKYFVLDKTLFKKDFYSAYNSTQRI